MFRPLPFSAALWTFIAFILGWLALLQDVGDISPDNLQKYPVVTYNVSFIGRDAAARYPAALATKIAALVPDADADATSVTRHLGGYDWYALYHFYVCKGYYAVDDKTHSLTKDKVDETCERMPKSYVFDLRETLRRDLDPSVAAELARIETPSGLRKFNLKASTAFLIIGLIFATFNLVLLPFAIMGRNRVNKCAAMLGFGAMVGFIVAASIDTNLALCAKAKGVTYTCGGYLGILWSGTAHTIIAAGAALWESFCEHWTPRGEPITTYKKPRDGDWRLWKTSPRSHMTI